MHPFSWKIKYLVIFEKLKGSFNKITITLILVEIVCLKLKAEILTHLKHWFPTMCVVQRSPGSYLSEKQMLMPRSCHQDSCMIRVGHVRIKTTCTDNNMWDFGWCEGSMIVWFSGTSTLSPKLVSTRSLIWHESGISSVAPKYYMRHGDWRGLHIALNIKPDREKSKAI